MKKNREGKSSDDDMKNLIHAWRTSKKYAEMRDELEKRIEYITKLKVLDINKLKEKVLENGLKKKEIEEIINSIIEYDALPSKDKMEYDWITEVAVLKTTKTEVYRDYIRNMINWYTHLFIYQQVEDYELCGRIKNVIDIETNMFIEILKRHFEYDSFDEKNIVEINEDLTKKILFNSNGEDCSNGK